MYEFRLDHSPMAKNKIFGILLTATSLNLLNIFDTF